MDKAFFDEILKLIKLRRFIGRVAFLVLMAVLLSLLDGCIVKVRQPLNLFYIIVGETIPIDGSLEKRVEDHKLLTYTSTSPMLNLEIEAVQRGYWFGGNMWIGKLTALKGIKTGEYEINVFDKRTNEKLHPVPIRIIVYNNKEELNKASLSVIQRNLNISPWIAALLLLPICIVFVGISFLMSNKIENLMKKYSMAEIYMKVPDKEGALFVRFELGKQDGLNEGDKVQIFDADLNPLGEAVVVETDKKDSTAKTYLGIESSYVKKA
ncbi:MAG: hypothetical protein N3A62_06440 [Thermodesulfovibrionales bacterium]|nr:hypothetical protein [Thermodesulfovibrionales bacterium]